MSKYPVPVRPADLSVYMCLLFFRSVMSNAGTALMGIGSGEGKTKAEDAANAAIASPLLDSPIDKAKGIVFNIIGGNDMSLQEVCFFQVNQLHCSWMAEPALRFFFRTPQTIPVSIGCSVEIDNTYVCMHYML